MNLSPHFTLEEMTTTNHNVDNIPDAASSVCLIRLCNDYLEPLRNCFGPLRVTSGYRSPELNAAIKGSARNSAHCFGCAADLQSIRGYTPNTMLIWLMAGSLDFDQAIDELRGTSTWLHLGMLRPGFQVVPRRQGLLMRNGKYSKVTI